MNTAYKLKHDSVLPIDLRKLSLARIYVVNISMYSRVVDSLTPLK